MRKIFLWSLAALTLTSVPVFARPESHTFTVPLGFCTVNPRHGEIPGTLVCDYYLGNDPSYGAELRARTITYLGRRNRPICVVKDVYDPAIPTIREGRIVATETECFDD